MICNCVDDEFYNRLREYKWNCKLIEQYKQLAKQHSDKLNEIPEQIRNRMRLFWNDFGAQFLLSNIKNDEPVKKRKEEKIRKKDIRKEKLPDISRNNNIKSNQPNNQVNSLNVKNVNLGLNNNNLPFKNNNYKLQFQNKNRKEYFELLWQEQNKQNVYPPINNTNNGNKKNNNINNNKTGEGTRIVLKKIKLKK